MFKYSLLNDVQNLLMVFKILNELVAILMLLQDKVIH